MQRFPTLVLTLVLAGFLTLPATPSSASNPIRDRAGLGDRTHPLVMQQAAEAANAPAAQPLYGAAGPREATIPLATRAATPLQREVFGFVNASNLGDANVGYPSWNFSLLKTVAFFGLQVNSGDGHLVSNNNTGWNVYHSSTMTGFVNAAHSNGVRVIVSINLHDFSTSPTNQVCTGLIAANQDQTVQWTMDAIAYAGIDGVNVDYEGSDTICSNGLSERDQLLSFMSKLRTAMPNKYIAIDTYSGSAEDNLEFFNVTELQKYVDSFFVMAYDMDEANYAEAPLNCSSYCFNPISPLNSYRFNVSKSMSQYLALVPASKIILGQPYYGRRGCGASLNSAHQVRTPGTNFVSPTYIYASTIPSQPGVVGFSSHRDPLDGVSEWDTWFDTDWNCNREQYFDDVNSLGVKYDLVNQDNLRGVGLFTLDYAGGSSEVWNELAAKFTTLTAWDSLGGIAASGPDPSSGTANHLDVFVRGTDHGLWHKSWDGTAWTAWEDLGGNLTAAPSAVSWGPNRTDVFVRGSDNALYQKTWNGTAWSNWVRLGGVLTAGPDAATWGVGRLDVLARGTDGKLWHIWFDGTAWSPWQSLGGYLTSDPAAISWAANRLDVFVRGSDFQLYHKFWDGTRWSNWEALGGYLTSGPDAASCTAGHLDVFVIGSDHGLWQKGWTGTAWSAWQPQGGIFFSDPGATCLTSTTNIALFESGVDSAVWHTSVPAS